MRTSARMKLIELGLGRTRDEVEQQGLGKVYLGFPVEDSRQQLEPNHKQLLFWGDIAENSPELVGTLPKDMIAVSWHYDAKPDFTKKLEPFIKAGLETWVAPGVNNWNRVYPNNNEALGNIRAFVRDGQKLGATGMLNTVWNDDGEGIFDRELVWRAVRRGRGMAAGRKLRGYLHCFVRAGISRRPDRQDQPGAARTDGGACTAQEGRPGRRAGRVFLDRSVFAGRPEW